LWGSRYKNTPTHNDYATNEKHNIGNLTVPFKEHFYSHLDFFFANSSDP
jgi:hypothetical protein